MTGSREGAGSQAGLLAVVPVRAGELPLGAQESVAEAGGRVVLAGSGTRAAAAALGGLAVQVRCWETPSYAPAAWAEALAPLLREEPVVVLPGSPDGRDLAARLAARLGRPVHCPALLVSATRVVVARAGGLQTAELAVTSPVVAALQPGVRGVEPTHRPAPPVWDLDLGPGLAPGQPGWTGPDPEPLGVLAAEPGSVELAQARRVLAVGAGVGSAAAVELAARVARALGAAAGATRVVTDAGWAPAHWQIGTTGTVVDPDLYLAVGVSGAVQHVSGIGAPGTVVAVNTDPSCPMMALADLALVCDAPALLAALAGRLSVALEGGAVGGAGGEAGMGPGGEVGVGPGAEAGMGPGGGSGRG